MPVVNRIAEFADDMKVWRRALHQIPELRFDCPKTSAFIKDRLAEIGVDEVHTGIAETGIVAIIEGQGAGPTIGLRADFDGLPIVEDTGLPHASVHEGKMHACGHDGHTTMLLGAARYLAETRNFSGRVALIFQPAEEDGGGAGVMINEGILDRFKITSTFALHTDPTGPAGHIRTTPGPIMAGVDDFKVTIIGKGGHAAYPHETRDPIPAALQAIGAFQSIVSRNHDPVEDLVISVTQIHGGTTHNVVPASVWFGGTLRSFQAKTRQMVLDRMQEICTGISQAFGVQATLEIQETYPATINHAAETSFAAQVAQEVVGKANTSIDRTPEMGAEDFAFFLEHRPGSYLFLTQGDGPGVHHPKFDFNDEIAPIGASFFARLVERAQPVDR